MAEHSGIYGQNRETNEGKLIAESAALGLLSYCDVILYGNAADD
jgi:hypothetical protein